MLAMSDVRRVFFAANAKSAVENDNNDNLKLDEEMFRKPEIWLLFIGVAMMQDTIIQ